VAAPEINGSGNLLDQPTHAPTRVSGTRYKCSS